MLAKLCEVQRPHRPAQRGQLLTAGTGERLYLLCGLGVSSEDFKLIVIQISWVRTDAMNKPDAEFYMQLICFHKP